MSCAFLSCFGAPPDSPQTFYSAGGRSLASTFRTGASFVTALENSPTTGAAPPAASPPKRARSLAAALEAAAAADEVVDEAGRPLSAASSAAATHDELDHEEPLTSHPLRSPSPSPSPTRSVKMGADPEAETFEDVDLASSPSPPPAAPSRSTLGVIENVRSVFTRKQQAAPAFGAPAAVVAADARSRAFRNPLFE